MLTDNSFFFDKVMLRVNHLPNKKEIKVLDMFSGDGKIWNKIKQLCPDKQIEVLPIEKEKRSGVYLRGDNLKFLNSLNLSNFDVIDMDAYGVPYTQLESVLGRIKKTTLFITFIQTLYGCLPTKMLNKLGYTSKMIKRCPTIFYRNGFDKFKYYLRKKGIKKIIHRTAANKHYICVIP